MLWMNIPTRGGLPARRIPDDGGRYNKWEFPPNLDVRECLGGEGFRPELRSAQALSPEGPASVTACALIYYPYNSPDPITDHYCALLTQWR